ncbi:MAG: prepilin-type N-terminal cleavage/methylation domain-containing protein [Rhodocyclaceae bacterium]|nr:prepilin-type N-terminal cleavage/methylation domain-containing protein [Rhodocyclaceae bacterium]
MKRYPHSRQSGLTLIEVVIALTIVSLVLLGLLGAMRTFARTADVVDGVTARIEEMTAVSRFIDRATSRMASGRLGEVTAQQPFVAGGEGKLAWLGILPASFGAGGVHLISLVLEPSRAGRPHVVLRFTPYYPGIEIERLPESAPKFRLDEVDALHVRFEDEDGEWRDEWVETEVLPARIAVVLEVAGVRWPDIVVRPYLVDPGSTGGGEIVIGGNNG